MREEHDPYGALRHPSYVYLLAGSVTASLGAEMLAVAVGWEIYERTHDELLLGIVGLVQFLPVLLLSLPAGQVVESHGRKGVLIGAQALMAGAALGLCLLSSWQQPVELFYPCLLAIGVGRAFAMPARWSLVPSVVPPELLGNAVTWNSSGWQVASVAGPSVGGLLIAWQGAAAPVYAATACCAVFCMVLVARIQPRPMVRLAERRSLATLFAGVRFVFQNRLMLATITLDLFAVLLGGATALLPVFAKNILDAGPVGLGWLRAAPSLGALLMALVLAHRPPLRRAGPVLLLAVTGFGFATVVFGLSRSFALSFAMLAITGALDNISVIVRGTLVQVLTPDSMRGRVAAVNAIFIGSSNELGAFESGVTARWWGPVASVVVGGVGTIVVVVAVLLTCPEGMRLGRLPPVIVPTPPPEDMPGSEAVV